MTSWIEVTRDEQRMARIEARACHSAGLPVDPLILSIAIAEPHSPEWITQQAVEDYNAAVARGERPTLAGFRYTDDDDEAPTNDISTAMNQGLTSMVEEERRRAPSERRVGRRPGIQPREPLPIGGSWLSKLFGR